MNRYLKRRFHRSATLGGLLACGLGLLGGCDAINPELITSLGGNTTETLRDAEGYVGIVIMNTTSVVAQVNMTILKTNEGVGELFATVAPYDSKSKDDHIMGVFECDVESIRLNSLTYASTGGEAVEIQFNYGSFVYGENLFCGDVIYITIAGSPPNVTASIGVY